MKAAAVIALQVITPELRTLSNPVVIEGHTDAARYGTSGYSNWELSAERANAARRVLEVAGLPPERVVEVRGLADRQPRVPNDPLAAANRRISILLPYSKLGNDDDAPPTTDAAAPAPAPAAASPARTARAARPAAAEPTIATAADDG